MVRFRSLGLTIKEVTGDTDYEDLIGIDNTDIIATTPEKFDSMTRKHRNRGGMRFFNEIGLVLLDEVHMLSEVRGSTLEAGVVSRIKLVAKKPEMAHVCQFQHSMLPSSSTNTNPALINAAPNIQHSIYCRLCHSPKRPGPWRMAPRTSSLRESLRRGDAPSKASHGRHWLSQRQERVLVRQTIK